MRVEAIANPHMLAWARRMAGLDVDLAAKKAGAKPDQLRTWEAGNTRPTVSQFRKLADAYKRPLAIFYRKELPRNDSIPPDFRRFDPTATDPLSPELRLAIRIARMRRLASLELFEDLKETPPEFSFRANLREDAERVAAGLRAAIAAGVSPSGDARQFFNFWRNAAETAGVLVFQVESIEIDEMRAISFSEQPLPVVVLNIQDAYQGRSFSLMHELTHIALGESALCSLEDRGPQTKIQRTEAFCNHVAGAALVPAHDLLHLPETPSNGTQTIDDQTTRAIARRFGVSPEVILRRLLIHGRVSPRFYEERRLRFLSQYAGIQRKKRGTGGPSRATLTLAREGRLFTRLVLTAYDEEVATASRVSELLGIKLKHLDSIREKLADSQ